MLFSTVRLTIFVSLVCVGESQVTFPDQGQSTTTSKATTTSTTTSVPKNATTSASFSNTTTTFALKNASNSTIATNVTTTLGPSAASNVTTAVNVTAASNTTNASNMTNTSTLTPALNMTTSLSATTSKAISASNATIAPNVTTTLGTLPASNVTTAANVTAVSNMANPSNMTNASNATTSSNTTTTAMMPPGNSTTSTTKITTAVSNATIGATNATTGSTSTVIPTTSTTKIAANTSTTSAPTTTKTPSMTTPTTTTVSATLKSSNTKQDDSEEHEEEEEENTVDADPSEDPVPDTTKPIAQITTTPMPNTSPTTTITTKPLPASSAAPTTPATTLGLNTTLTTTMMTTTTKPTTTIISSTTSTRMPASPNVTRASLCVTTGYCEIAGGVSSSDGGSKIESRLGQSETAKQSQPSGNRNGEGDLNNNNKTGTSIQMTSPAQTGSGPLNVNQTQCDIKTELCSTPLGYQCGLRYPPVVGSPIVTTNAVYGSHPWHGIVFKGNEYFTSGALIDNQFFLTVAQKVFTFASSFSTLKVRLGDWNISSDKEPYPHQEFKIASIIVHPDYNDISKKNNVALLQLADPVNLGQVPTIGTACLPSSPISGIRCVLPKYTRTVQNVTTFSVQNEVVLPLVNSSTCEANLRKTTLGPKFILDSSSFVCAGGEEGNDACVGDAGAPLMCEVANKFYITGLVTWGIGCGVKDVPGVYVNITNFIPWIQNMTRALQTKTKNAG